MTCLIDPSACKGWVFAPPLTCWTPSSSSLMTQRWCAWLQGWWNSPQGGQTGAGGVVHQGQHESQGGGHQFQEEERVRFHQRSTCGKGFWGTSIPGGAEDLICTVNTSVLTKVQQRLHLLWRKCLEEKLQEPVLMYCVAVWFLLYRRRPGLLRRSSASPQPHLEKSAGSRCLDRAKKMPTDRFHPALPLVKSLPFYPERLLPNLKKKTKTLPTSPNYVVQVLLSQARSSSAFWKGERIAHAPTELRWLFHHRETRYENRLDCCACTGSMGRRSRWTLLTRGGMGSTSVNNPLRRALR